jgi:chromosome segregation ATPase
MSALEDLKKQREELQNKIKQTEDMIGKGMSWKDAQFYLEKYQEEIRVLDNKIARVQLGEDALSELKSKKQQLQNKLQELEELKKTGEVSKNVYNEKKRDIEKEIEQVERDIVETM